VQLCKTQTIRSGSQESPPSVSILPIFLYGSGQLPREMHSRLMLSINGVCESCQE